MQWRASSGSLTVIRKGNKRGFVAINDAAREDLWQLRRQSGGSALVCPGNALRWFEAALRGAGIMDASEYPLAACYVAAVWVMFS